MITILYSINLSSLLIGCLLKQPSLLAQPQYPLDKNCFAPEQFHKIMYLAIQRLYNEGVGEITEVEIENIVKNKPAYFEIIQDNNFCEFISTVKELSVIENYEYYYTVTRKFALLRDLQSNGIDIKDYYNELEDENEQNAKLEKLSIQDILNDVELKGVRLRNKYDVKYVRTEMTAGEDTEDLIKEFEQNPAFGAFLCSPYLTQLYMGWCRTHLIVESAPSGIGKTRMSIKDLCEVSVDKLWDDEAQDFIENLNYQGSGAFIHTELRAREEINPMFLACVSGVNVKHITQGILTHEEKLRVLKAGEILSVNNLKIADMADFTCQSIERKIKEYVESYGMQYCIFDYVQLNSAVTQEYRKNTEAQAREDLILRNITLELKNMAEKYNVGIKTMTQLNGNEKNMDFPDESCLSGGKSQKNKLDAACITLPVKDRIKEFKRIEPYLKRKGFGKDSLIVPNVVSYVFKSRFGEYADQKIKVWRYFDRGIFRNTDFFCTNQYDEIVNIQKPVLKDDF